MSWTSEAISAMFSSNTPSVFGLVSMRQATSSSIFERRSSMSTPPVSLVATFTTSYPAIETEAGLVPWAVSGVRTLRGFLPLSLW